MIQSNDRRHRDKDFDLSPQVGEVLCEGSKHLCCTLGVADIAEFTLHCLLKHKVNHCRQVVLRHFEETKVAVRVGVGVEP